MSRLTALGRVPAGGGVALASQQRTDQRIAVRPPAGRVPGIERRRIDQSRRDDRAVGSAIDPHLLGSGGARMQAAGA
jgi:hypothetical protein